MKATTRKITNWFGKQWTALRQTKFTNKQFWTLVAVVFLIDLLLVLYFTNYVDKRDDAIIEQVQVNNQKIHDLENREVVVEIPKPFTEFPPQDIEIVEDDPVEDVQEEPKEKVEDKKEDPIVKEEPKEPVSKFRAMVPDVSDEDYERFIAGVKHWEGFKNRPYYCVGGAKTIGYGFTGKEVKGRKYISKKTADWELENEVLPRYLELVFAYVNVELNGYQKLSLTDFTFNLGEGNLKQLVSQKGRLNDGNYDKVTRYMVLYVNAGGKRKSQLVLRRNWERDVWNGTVHTNYGN